MQRVVSLCKATEPSPPAPPDTLPPHHAGGVGPP